MLRALCFLLLLPLFFMWRRNREVYFFISGIERRVAELEENDKWNRRLWHWRRQELYKVGYGTILFQFWKPLKLENFYENADFLEE